MILRRNRRKCVRQELWQERGQSRHSVLRSVLSPVGWVSEIDIKDDEPSHSRTWPGTNFPSADPFRRSLLWSALRRRMPARNRKSFFAIGRFNQRIPVPQPDRKKSGKRVDLTG